MITIVIYSLGKSSQEIFIVRFISAIGMKHKRMEITFLPDPW